MLHAGALILFSVVLELELCLSTGSQGVQGLASLPETEGKNENDLPPLLTQVASLNNLLQQHLVSPFQLGSSSGGGARKKVPDEVSALSRKYILLITRHITRTSTQLRFRFCSSTETRPYQRLSPLTVLSKCAVIC